MPIIQNIKEFLIYIYIYNKIKNGSEPLAQP